MKKSAKKIAAVAAPAVTYTRDEIVSRCFSFLVDDIERRVVIEKETVATWAIRLTEEDPSRAFEWSNDAFRAAARVKVGKTVLAWIEAGKQNSVDEYSSTPSCEKIIRGIRDHLYGEVVRKAKWPDRSTSVQSNEMSLEINAEMAEMLEKLDRAIERMEEA